MYQMPDNLPDETQIFYSNRWVFSNAALGSLIAFWCFKLFTGEQPNLGYFYATKVSALILGVGFGAVLFFTAKEKLEYTYWAKNRKSYIRLTRESLYLFGSKTRIPWSDISSIRLVRLPGGRAIRHIHLLLGLTPEAQSRRASIPNLRQLTSSNVFIAGRDRLVETSFLTLPLDMGNEVALARSPDEVLAFAEAYWLAAGDASAVAGSVTPA